MISTATQFSSMDPHPSPTFLDSCLLYEHISIVSQANNIPDMSDPSLGFEILKMVDDSQGSEICFSLHTQLILYPLHRSM